MSRDFSSSRAAIRTRNSVATSRSSSPRRLEVVEVGEHEVGQLDLEQVDLLAQDERQQQVERPEKTSRSSSRSATVIAPEASWRDPTP